MPPLNNRIHACIQRVMLSFDDFSIKRRYKEKTVRIIKISLENKAICAGGNRTQDAPRSGALGRGVETAGAKERHCFYMYSIFAFCTSPGSFSKAATSWADFGSISKKACIFLKIIYTIFIPIFSRQVNLFIMHGSWPWYWRIAELSLRNVTGEGRIAYGREERNYCV